MFEFELEKGSKKHACPACSQKTFVRYVRRTNGEYLGFDVGRCDRESRCGYHYKPKEFFLDNPQAKIGKIGNYKKGKNLRKPKILQCEVSTKQGITNDVLTNKNSTITDYQANKLPEKADFIPNNVFLQTLTRFEQNAFVQFLLNLFADDPQVVRQAVKTYFIGSTKDGKTIFWQIDQSRRIRTGKIIAYNPADGKRRKDISPNWIHAELKRRGLLNADFNLKQCFFGEHLLLKTTAPIAVVEAEKTAVIASICFPSMLWLAIGAKHNLKADKLKRLGRNRRIILYPDADGFALWQEIALQACFNGQTVKVSNLIELRGTNAEKTEGFDLADYLINEQKSINQYNSFVDSYNAKLESILADEKLNNQLYSILDEQKSILITGDKFSETEAEKQVMKFDNLRQIVMRIKGNPPSGASENV